MISIIDYDAGNIKSVEKAIKYLGSDVLITRDADTILSSNGIILPGVGAFGDAMNRLSEYGLTAVIKEAVARDIPFLGICLGLQLLFDESEESPGVKGLSLLKGKIKRIPDNENLKIPHIGWNDLKLSGNGRLFDGIPENPYVYFVHSYYLEAEDESIVKASAEYGVKIHASVEKGKLFACQFHPEKSSDVGLRILSNFINLTKDGEE
ncbi:MAG: imidazole glycerol phosphate synthase subunit HisH [Lachnospiraceae bacterium]|nr:imidazole glycerol phosphate synthase subunit HisH [Lachnospiraceae bacterium]